MLKLAWKRNLSGKWSLFILITGSECLRGAVLWSSGAGQWSSDGMRWGQRGMRGEGSPGGAGPGRPGLTTPSTSWLSRCHRESSDLRRQTQTPGWKKIGALGIDWISDTPGNVLVSQGSILGSQFAPWSQFWVSGWPMVADADIRALPRSVLSAWFTGGGTCNVCTNHNLTSHLQPHVPLSLIRSLQGTSGSWHQKSVCYWFKTRRETEYMSDLISYLCSSVTKNLFISSVSSIRCQTIWGEIRIQTHNWFALHLYLHQLILD